MTESGWSDGVLVLVSSLLHGDTVPATIVALAVLVLAYGWARSRIILAKATAGLLGRRRPSALAGRRRKADDRRAALPS
jgi:hypothetical protein